MRIETQLHAIAHGDRAVFSALYCELRPALLSYATGLMAGDRSGAEDVVNEAFIAIWEQAANYAGHGNAHGWIRRIVRNKAIDQIRRQRDVSMNSEGLAHLEQARCDEREAQDAVLERAETGRALISALDALSVEHREVVWLCYYEERRLAEIASLVSCPENTVKTRLFHARTLLRKNGALQCGAGV